MKTVELVFVPSPGLGHLVSILEFSNRLLDQNDRLSVTVLLIVPPNVAPDAFNHLFSASNHRIRYVNLPQADPPPAELANIPENYVSVFIDSHRPYVKEAVDNHILSDPRKTLGGFVIDMFCTSMIDVANEFDVPSYLFHTSGAAFLGFMLHLSVRHGEVGRGFKLGDCDLLVPTYANPVPSAVLPAVVLDEEHGYPCFLRHGTRFRETRGLIVNTFSELEPYALDALASDGELPRVFPVGPLLKVDHHEKDSVSTDSAFIHGPGSNKDIIMKWLDDQPPSSVVFLCFGSLGGFDPPQLAQMAVALEHCGYRFLWSIRRPFAKLNLELRPEYDDFNEVLPQGFLERTKNRGMVCGWAPQVEVLGHMAVGGFVTHCGWNSILESVCQGVPLAAWPIYAEQQINALEVVKDLGVAVEVKMDYNRWLGKDETVMGDEIEKAIRCLMDEKNPVRKKARDLREESRKAIMEGGSSFISLGCLVQHILQNIIE